LERAKRYNYPVTFLMLDIDRFKEVNDIYGHQVGDLILKSVGRILMGQTRKIDTIIRYGGDEFLLILPNFKQENIEGFKNRINTAVIQLNKETKILDFDIGLSTGIGYWYPGENLPVEKAVDDADGSMYDEKRRKVRKK
ncbi:MAG: GGDEF domain-containing protein, partial [Actinobacteria bacterium]|nr:GGDEF domain-containing protein [Actinomycetota bacterium]